MRQIVNIGQWLALILMVVGLWGIFAKAERKPWLSLIPIYNLCVLCQICGLSPWLGVLFLIPLVNLIFWIFVCDDLAEAFGKTTPFALGLFFLGFVFLPVLGFGTAQYQKKPEG